MPLFVAKCIALLGRVVARSLATCYPYGMDINRPTKAQSAALLAALEDPMALVTAGLQAREESSRVIADQVSASAATIRVIRSEQHTGSLRVDVWADIVRWLLTH